MDKRFISGLLKGLVSTSFGSIVTIGLHFLSIALMTRYVSVEALGLYFLAFAMAQVLKIIGGLGLDLTLSKFISGADQGLQQDTVASTIIARFIAVTAVGIIFYAAGQFILPLFGAGLKDFIVLIIILFAMTSFREMFLYLMQGMRQFKGYAFVEVLSAASRVMLLIMFREKLSLQALLIIDILSQFISLLFQLFLARSLLLGLSRKNIKAKSVRNLTRFSLPLYSNNILTLIHDRSSTFLIGALLNPISVAAFEIALKVPDGFMRLFNSFIIVYFPSLSNLFAKGNRDDAHRMMNSSLVTVSTGINFAVLVVFLFGREIVLVLFTEEYLEVSLAFALLMLNFYLRAISNILGYSLVAAGNSSAPVKANLVSCTVNIVGSLILIKIFGYIGAVYSLLLMNLTSLVIYELILRRATLAPHSLAYLKPVFMLAVAISIDWLFGGNSILLKVLLTGLYIAGCWLFIEEIKGFSHTAMKHVFRPRAHSESA